MNIDRLFLCSLSFLTLSFLTTTLSAEGVSSLQEGIELRRIGEYCKEKNYAALKSQIHTFLSKYPQSKSTDPLHAMLGDLLFKEADYSQALSSYNQIKNEEFRTRTEFKRIHCLHQLAKFDQLITAALSFMNRATEAEVPTLRLQLANALFRHALAIDDAGKKRELLQMAKEQFHLLSETQLLEQGLSPLAYIHTFLKEYPEAVKMYLTLSEKDPANKEEYLLQIAQLQLRYDKTAAINTYEKIYSAQGKSAAQAAFNQLSLLFQDKRYKDLLVAQEKAIQHIAKEQLSTVQYYIGRSLYQCGDSINAVTMLLKSLSVRSDDPAREKNALLTIVQCAKESADLPLLDKASSLFKTSFPEDEENVKISLLHAQMCIQQKQWDRATDDLKDLLERHPHIAQRDNILYDYILLLVQNSKWTDAIPSCEQFIQEFPAHIHTNHVWRHLINCHVKITKEATSETVHVYKERLADVLTRSLEQQTLLSTEERQKNHFLLAKILCEVNKYVAAIQELNTYVQKHPSAEAYLLLALCHQKVTHDPDPFIESAEMSLTLNPNMAESKEIRRTLFNVCLAQAETRKEEEKKKMLLRAADHLYQALDPNVKRENQLWLANFYFDQYRKSLPQDAEFFLDRTTKVLEKLLQFHGESPSLAITADTLQMEGEAIKLAKLYDVQGKHKERIALLCALTEEQVRNPQVTWKYQRLALFDLATAYRKAGDSEKAIATYSFLINSSAFATSYFSTLAQLERATLYFSLLPPEEKKENSTKVQAICDTLKELQIKKKLFSEPCHLEAAFSYIDILCELTPLTQRQERKLLLLRQLKENFSSPDDILVAEYLSAGKEFPEKKQIHEDYMRFTSASIMQLEAQSAKDTAKAKKARALIESILSPNTHPRLKERMEEL